MGHKLACLALCCLAHLESCSTPPKQEQALATPETRPLLEMLSDAGLEPAHIRLPGLYVRSQGTASAWEMDRRVEADGSVTVAKIPLDYTWGTVQSLGLPGIENGIGCGLLFHTRGDPVIGSYVRVDFTPWFKSQVPPNPGKAAWLILGLRGAASHSETYTHTDGTQYPVDLGPAGKLWGVPDIVIPMPAAGFSFGSENNGIFRQAGEVQGYVAAWFPDDPAWVGQKVWVQVAVESPGGIGLALTDARVVTLGWPYPKFSPTTQRWTIDKRYLPQPR